jgi:hypothetical protein
MTRRAFITLLGVGTAWPLTAWAQQGGQTRRIGVFMPGLAALKFVLHWPLDGTKGRSNRYASRAPFGCAERSLSSLCEGC